MVECIIVNRFRKRSVEMEQGRARIYSEASPPEIYGSPDFSAVGKSATASPCWQRSGLVSDLSRALEFAELRRSHWRSCASSKRLSQMSTKNGAGDQIWQHKIIHSINLTSFTCKMEVVVDLQGFTKPINEFVLKELAALEVNNSNNTPVIILFEPPCEWDILPAEYRVENSWLRRNYHGIPWSSGNSPYEAAGPIIRGILQRARTIYVKGLEKKIWLSNLIGGTKEIIDLDSLGCPSLCACTVVRNCWRRAIFRFTILLSNVLHCFQFYCGVVWLSRGIRNDAQLSDLLCMCTRTSEFTTKFRTKTGRHPCYAFRQTSRDVNKASPRLRPLNEPSSAKRY